MLTRLLKRNIPSKADNNFLSLNQSKASPDEMGTIEAGMALIPTTVFFILMLQVVLAGSWQVIERAKIHAVAIRSTIASDTKISQDIADIAIETKNLPYGNLHTFSKSEQIPIFGALLNWLDKDSARLRVTTVSIT